MVVGYLTLPELLKQIKTEKNPGEFKETLLRAIQLYFDGLIENRQWNGLFLFWRKPLAEIKNQEIWEEQKETLDAILSGVQMTVSGFYRNSGKCAFF